MPDAGKQARLLTNVPARGMEVVQFVPPARAVTQGPVGSADPDVASPHSLCTPELAGFVGRSVLVGAETSFHAGSRTGDSCPCTSRVIAGKELKERLLPQARNQSAPSCLECGLTASGPNSCVAALSL